MKETFTVGKKIKGLNYTLAKKKVKNQKANGN